jgi:hypothetical protein
MENDLLGIVERVRHLIFELAPQVTGEAAEFTILYSIADDILARAQVTDETQHKFLRKGLVNMFLAGRMFPEKEVSSAKS